MTAELEINPNEEEKQNPKFSTNKIFRILLVVLLLFIVSGGILISEEVDYDVIYPVVSVLGILFILLNLVYLYLQVKPMKFWYRIVLFATPLVLGLLTGIFIDLYADNIPLILKIAFSLIPILPLTLISLNIANIFNYKKDINNTSGFAVFYSTFLAFSFFISGIFALDM